MSEYFYNGYKILKIKVAIILATIPLCFAGIAIAGTTPISAEDFIALSHEYHEKGQYDLAISTAQKAVSLLEDKSKKINLAAAYNNLGGMYFSKGQYDISLAYFKRALDIATVLFGGNDPSVENYRNNVEKTQQVMGIR